MNTLWLSLGTAVALGATSGVHCAAMCGPLAAVGTSIQGKLEKNLALGYLFGRLCGYSLLGAMAGAVAAPWAAGDAGQIVRFVLAMFVACLLIYRAIALVRPAAAERLVRLGKRPSGPSFFQKLVRFVPRRGFGLGMATALFPCGALLSGVLAAASSGSAALGAAMMALFAVASAPLLMLPAMAASTLRNRLQSAWARRVGAAVLIGAAVWVVLPSVRSWMGHSDKPACCTHDGQA